MISQSDLLKFIIQLLVSFSSLLGVYVVFRLNSAGSAINNSWATLDNSLSALGKSIKQFPPREKLKEVFKWVGDSNEPIITRVTVVNEILHDIFNQVSQKKIVIGAFLLILSVCFLVSTSCLYCIWVLPMPYFWGFGFLMFILFLFPAWALKNAADWKYWAKQKKEWENIYINGVTKQRGA